MALRLHCITQLSECDLLLDGVGVNELPVCMFLSRRQTVSSRQKGMILKFSV